MQCALDFCLTIYFYFLLNAIKIETEVTEKEHFLAQYNLLPYFQVSYSLYWQKLFRNFFLRLRALTPVEVAIDITDEIVSVFQLRESTLPVRILDLTPV